MRDEWLYLTDIVEAAAAISRFIAGLSEDDWIEDEVKVSSSKSGGGGGHRPPLSKLSAGLRPASPQIIERIQVKQGAVMHRLIIIGEAAARLPREFRERHPEVNGLTSLGFATSPYMLTLQ